MELDLKALMEMVWAREAQVAIQANESNNGSPILSVALPSNYGIHSLESYMPAPVKFRAHFRTSHISHFEEYVKNNCTSDTQVFVNTADGSAEAIIDMGTEDAPKNGLHVAQLKLVQTVELRGLLGQTGSWSNQAEFLDFLADWEDLITFVMGDELAESGLVGKSLDAKSGMMRFRKMSASKSSGMSSEVRAHAESTSAFDKVNIDADGETPPDLLVFRCKMYEDYYTIAPRCRIITTVRGSDILFKLRLIGFETLKREAGEDLKQRLEETFKEADISGIYAGSMAYPAK